MTRDDILAYAAWLKHCGVVLYGERIGVVRDDADEFAGEKKLIAVPDTHKRRPKTGTVVLVGLGIRNEPGDSTDPDPTQIGLHIGDKVLFNVYNTLEVSIPDASGKPQEIAVFHGADIYFGFRPDTALGVK